MGFFDKKKKVITTPPKPNDLINENAQVIEWTPQWDSGAPMPQVFSNGRKTYLIYLINEPDSDWDGTYVTMIDNTSETKYPLALIEFDGRDFRFGIANDEVHHGLPLWNQGLKHYSAHIIENSSWIEEIKKVNKVHAQYNENRWIGWKHYVLLFHDELLEVIARGYRVEAFRATFKELAEEVVRRMNK